MRYFRIFMFVLVLIGISGFSIPASAGTDEISVRLVGVVDSLDPAHLRRPHTTCMAWNIYSTLVKFKPGGSQIEPDLAESWDISKDGKTYTFHLKRGVKWQKGFGEVTSEDVKYSLERVQDPKTKSPYRRDLKIIEKIETPDKYTLRITLKYSYPAFIQSVLAFRAGMVVNRKAVEKFGNRYDFNPVGSGPYAFENYIRGEKVTLVRNPDYYGPKPAIEKAVFRIIRDDTVVELALKKGDVDIAYTTNGEVNSRLLKSKVLKTYSMPGFRVHELALNTKSQFLKDKRVRQALHYAIDKDGICYAVFNDLAEPSKSVMNPNTFGYHPETVYKYDPEKAKQLMKAAGMEKGFKMVAYTNKAQSWPKIIPIIKENWKAIGVDAKIMAVERSIYLEHERKGDYGAMGFNLTRIMADQYMYAFLHSSNAKGGRNVSNYDQADKLIEMARTTTSEQKSEQFYKELQIKLTEDVPIIPVLVARILMTTTARVQGAKPGFMDMVDLRSIRLKK